MKVCINGQGHMTKMAAMPIYGKNLKVSSPELAGQFPQNFIVYINDDPGVTLTYFTARSNFVTCRLFYRKKRKQWIFQKLLKSAT